MIFLNVLFKARRINWELPESKRIKVNLIKMENKIRAKKETTREEKNKQASNRTKFMLYGVFENKIVAIVNVDPLNAYFLLSRVVLIDAEATHRIGTRGRETSQPATITTSIATTFKLFEHFHIPLSSLLLIVIALLDIFFLFSSLFWFRIFRHHRH